MEIELFGHLVSIYGNPIHFIFRLYDSKRYVWLTISTIKNCQYGIHKCQTRDFHGNYVFHH